MTYSKSSKSIRKSRKKSFSTAYGASSGKKRKRNRKWSVGKRRHWFVRYMGYVWRYGVFVIAFVLLVVFSTYFLFFTPYFVISEIHAVSEYKDINPEKVERFLSPEINGLHQFLVDIPLIEKDLTEQFPEISRAKCSRSWINQSVVCQIEGYELVAVIKHQGKKYYINENGVVIAYDSRKLGLPNFDLILNPVFSQDNKDSPRLVAEDDKTLLSSDPLASALITAQEKLQEQQGDSDEFQVTPKGAISFITPQSEPPIIPVVRRPRDNPFTVVEGKKILDPEEINRILEAINQLEQVLERKVTEVQYVQVASELSLTTKQVNTADPNFNSEESAVSVESQVIPSVNEKTLVVLLDLRRDLPKQLLKLQKTKEVVDFSTIDQIDLSIDGQKVFYR